MKLAPATVSITLAFAVVAAATAGCKDKSATEATPAASAAASAAASGAKPAEEKAATNAPKEVTLDQFLGKVAPAACKTITSCKNDKVKVMATMPMMMIAGFGTMDKPELKEQLKSVDTSMKGDKRFLPNEDECTKLGGIAMKVLGVDASALDAKVGKTVSYDSKKAAACLESLAKAPNECGTEVKLAKEPKLSEMGAFEKELKPSIDAFTKPCEHVLEGLVEQGDACELDVECKGEKTKCAPAKGKAKGKDAKAKTCQKKGAF